MANAILFSGSTMISDLQFKRRIAGYTKTCPLHRYLIPVTKRQPEALYAFKSRGFGGETGVVTANMKWCGAFLFGAIVLPIVILNFVVAFVFPKFPDDLDLTSQFRFVCGRVDGTWYGRDTLLGG